MPVPCYLRRAVYTIAIIGWLVVIADATPLDPFISENTRALAVLAAAVGSIKYLMRRMYAPAHDLFAAGKLAGRAEALAEQHADIVRLDDRRPLRAVPPAAGDGHP